MSDSPHSSRSARRAVRLPAVDRGGDGPRERLAALGARALSDAELLALILRTGHRECDALAVGRALLLAHGGLRGLAAALPRELALAPGLGPAKAASLASALELARRTATRSLEPGARFGGPADVHAHFAARLRDLRQERFFVVMLDGRHRVIGEQTVSQGTLTASLVHPREVFRPALRVAAAAVVLVHNHPSGDPEPSSEDRRVTERLARAGELLGVRVVDHVVVAEAGFFSFREGGLLADPAPPAPLTDSPAGA